MSEIKYWTPVQNAWDKMVQVLFRPFDIGKWMVIGFAAFLANCGRDNGGGGNGGSSGGSGNSKDWSGEEVQSGLSDVMETVTDAWFEYSTAILLTCAAILVLLILISILINWLNSRGQFMLLDNVVKNRGAVKEPWGEYRKEANSLMIFQILFNWSAGLIVLGLIAGMVLPILGMLIREQFAGRLLGITIGSFSLFMIFCLVFGFVNMILTHFVVPLMYQRRLKVLDGFRAFAPVLKGNFWRIVLFGLVMILVQVAIGVAVFLGILLTCCTALLLLIIPYIGTVAMLPVFVFQRFIGPEFLRQFGDEYDLLSEFNKPQDAGQDDPEECRINGGYYA